jgi:polysaccharide transporter, PST family
MDRKIVETAISLYGAQAANHLLPLVTIPYLARVLGPESWGLVLFVQAVGYYLFMAIDYSFELSATRDVARNRHNQRELSLIVAGVLGARLILAISSIALLATAQFFLDPLQELGWLLWFGAFWFIAMGARPLWFFLGLERVRRVLITEVCLKMLAVGGILLLVNSPNDAWKFFALQGGATAIAALTAMVMLYRQVAVRLPTTALAIEALRKGWNLFVFRASTSVYGTSNTTILGFVASPIAVAYYSAAERIMRVLLSMLVPVTQSMFPRSSTRYEDDPGSAARMARITIIALFCLTLPVSIVLYFLLPSIVNVFLGAGYEGVVTVTRILLLVLLINSISIPLGNQWMIPAGMERLLTKITITGGIIHIPVAIYLGAHHAHLGIAWAFVMTEFIILSLLISLLLTKGLGPFRFRER